MSSARGMLAVLQVSHEGYHPYRGTYRAMARNLSIVIRVNLDFDSSTQAASFNCHSEQVMRVVFVSFERGVRECGEVVDPRFALYVIDIRLPAVT